MEIAVFPLGPLETNSYLAVNGDKALAVDVGGDPARMLEFLKRRDLTLEAVCLTHLHCDHIYGVAALAEAAKVPVLAPAEDAYLFSSEIGRGGFMGLPLVADFAWEGVGPGERTLIGRPCRLLSTPGHTAGSLCYYFPEDGVVFAGDVLFYRSIGRTDFPGGDYDALIAGVVREIFSLPDDVVVYPGHGPETSVGDEKTHNPFFTEFQR